VEERRFSAASNSSSELAALAACTDCHFDRSPERSDGEREICFSLIFCLDPD